MSSKAPSVNVNSVLRTLRRERRERPPPTLEELKDLAANRLSEPERARVEAALGRYPEYRNLLTHIEEPGIRRRFSAVAIRSSALRAWQLAWPLEG